MTEDAWRTGMAQLYAIGWPLVAQLEALRDSEGDRGDARQLAYLLAQVSGALSNLLWFLSAVAPDADRHAVALDSALAVHTSLASIAEDDGGDPLPALLATLADHLRLVGNGLYGSCLILGQEAHGPAGRALRLATIGRELAAPASILAEVCGLLADLAREAQDPPPRSLFRGLCHTADGLVRAVLHLMSVCAYDRPCALSMPSPRVPRPGEEPGPWPGWADFELVWRVRFGGGA